MPGQEKQGNRGILGCTILILASSTYAAIMKRLEANTRKHANMIQEQKMTEECFKTCKTTFARGVTS